MNALILVVILALVEGITEFLPVSSTGHMILVNKLIGGEYLSPTFTNSFLIIIQLGAILSVVVYFWKDLTASFELPEMYSMIPGFLLATLMIVVISLITPAPNAKTSETFEKANKAYLDELK